MLPVGQVLNYADRVAESFLSAILRLAAAGKLSKPSSPAPVLADVEVMSDAGLKREAAAQVWLWDANKHEMHKEKERVGDEIK